jgi:hypothetical protein
MKYRAACHFNGFAFMVRKHEYGGVERRIVAPPAFPTVIRPLAADRTEHVAPHYPGADVLESPSCKVVVYASRAGFASGYPLKRCGWNEPLMQPVAALAERIVQALPRAGSKPIQGNGKTLDS